MLYSAKNARDNVRNRNGKRVFYLGKGDQLTAEARDFLNRERIEILPAEKAKVERFRLLSGGYMEEKPEHMTHLTADLLVPKTHPRIAFRGTMDTLEAELLWCASGLSKERSAQVAEVLDLARKLLRCDVLDEPVGELVLCGLTQQEQRQRSHFPQEYYRQAHFMPEITEKETVLRLNKARCAARAAELAGAAAFQDREGNPTRPDILQALNRMSSMLYILMIQEKAQQ